KNSSISDSLHLHETTVEGGPASGIREPIGSESVGVAASGRPFSPAYRGGGDHTGLHRIVHLGYQNAGATVVVDANLVGRLDGPCGGIGDTQVQRGGFEIHRIAMSESGIHAVIVLGRNHLERIFPPNRLVAMARFHRRRVVEIRRTEVAL